MNKLIDFSYDSKKLKIVESLRYEKLLNNTKYENKSTSEVLVLLDYSEKSNQNLLEILNKSDLIKKSNIILKKHPLKQSKKLM